MSEIYNAWFYCTQCKTLWDGAKGDNNDEIACSYCYASASLSLEATQEQLKMVASSPDLSTYGLLKEDN